MNRDKETSTSAETTDSSKNKQRVRAKKRKRDSSEEEDVLPENTLEIEKNLHASALKNHLDDVSVKKILKKVVTNDHVLAFVKLREEEENVACQENMQPKLTRAKAKELMKASPKSAPWNLELIPINHIPFKTRPEVKALIAQELPEDEDDEDYQPTHDDLASDDDHTACSDIDSQPATPATPKSQTKSSPKVVKDGPFKVPQETVSHARRQLDLEEEATIALRTRSKLSLSETPIEHIESSFIPPDDIPLQDVDDLWNDFLKDCLNPGPNTRHEDDDEADPEYNVAADPDAVEEDEESLENSLIKISKKELNDLVTELFNVMPESQVTQDLTDATIVNGTQPNIPWEGKQEPTSDDEESYRSSTGLVFEKHDSVRLSIGKSEPQDPDQQTSCSNDKNTVTEPAPVIVIEEIVLENSDALEPPPALRSALNAPADTIKVEVDSNVITETQLLILQQQLRMHIQICASNFLQLFVHPVHWSFAPKYKEYLETFNSMVGSKEKSVVNVCNLKPALELVTAWENTVSQETPENKKMVEFIQGEMDKCRQKSNTNNVYVADFPEEVKKVIANSPVFLYPHLLPAMAYRSETRKRNKYLLSEDQLIILGLDQWWSYVEANPDLFPMGPIINPRHRWGLTITLDLICKYMLPWLSPRTLAFHIATVRRQKRKDHPIIKYFKSRHIEPLTHRLIPFNPKLTLYEHPESEMPRIWLRYLAKSSKRFRTFMSKKRQPECTPRGIEVVPGESIKERVTEKAPLPITFSEVYKCNRIDCHSPKPSPTDKLDIDIEKQSTDNIVLQIQTEGTDLETDDMEIERESPVIETPIDANNTDSHCACCDLLRNICKHRQTRITEYIKKFNAKMMCPCRSIKHPKVTNKLKLLLTYYKSRSHNIFADLKSKLDSLKAVKDVKRVVDLRKEIEDRDNEAKDLAFVSSFQTRLTIRENKARNQHIKKRIFSALSHFKPDDEDPLQLMQELYKACDVDLADMYTEFVAFLNPEQADKIDMFREYFIQNCMEDLVRKTEELVSDTEKKSAILKYLLSIFRNNPEACVLCSELLYRMRDYPQLARYCFSLFPHRRKGYNKGHKSIRNQMTHPHDIKINSATEKYDDNSKLVKQPFVKISTLTLPDQSENPINEEINKNLPVPPSTIKITTQEGLSEAHQGNNNDLIPQNPKTTILILNNVPYIVNPNTVLPRNDDVRQEHIIESNVTHNVNLNLQNNVTKTNHIIIKEGNIIGSGSVELTYINSEGEQEPNLPVESPLIVIKPQKPLPNDVNQKNGTNLSNNGSGQAQNLIIKEIDIVTPNIIDTDIDNENYTQQKGVIISDANRVQETEKLKQEIKSEDDDVDVEQEGKLTICEDTSRAAITSSDDETKYIGPDTNIASNKSEDLKIKLLEEKVNASITNIVITEELQTKNEIEDMDQDLLDSSAEEYECEVEWKREEDKIILEILQQHLTPQERKGKSVIDFIEEKNIPQTIADFLEDRSLHDVRDRVYYLLRILVLNELN
ncbi:unnamed protein product [Leptosia nina]|uniref:Uncharacterized protein n=1 Tax=Leptosia nina TaxID=320188 RepID=A0AAV1JW68_9NEOP